MGRENREIRRKTRYIGQSTYIQSNCFIFDPTPVLSPFYSKSFKKLYFYLPGLKCCYVGAGGAGIEIEGSAKKLKERPRC